MFKICVGDIKEIRKYFCYRFLGVASGEFFFLFYFIWLLGFEILFLEFIFMFFDKLIFIFIFISGSFRIFIYNIDFYLIGFVVSVLIVKYIWVIEIKEFLMII